MTGQRNKPAVSMAEIKPELARLRRRGLLRNALSLGALTMLTGCDLSTHSGVDAALWAMLRFDDWVQAALFSRRRLAQTYPASAITRPFRFNAYYAEWQVRPVPDNWGLSVGGLVADRRPWTLQALMALPQQGQITRHICIEGWSQIGQWSGVPLGAFLRPADSRISQISALDAITFAYSVSGAVVRSGESIGVCER